VILVERAVDVDAAAGRARRVVDTQLSPHGQLLLACDADGRSTASPAFIVDRGSTGTSGRCQRRLTFLSFVTHLSSPAELLLLLLQLQFLSYIYSRRKRCYVFTIFCYTYDERRVKGGSLKLAVSTKTSKYIVDAVQLAICRVYWVDKILIRGHEVSAFFPNRWRQVYVSNVKKRLWSLITNRFSEANYRIIFAKNVMPEKHRRVFWTQFRASMLAYTFWPGH